LLGFASAFLRVAFVEGGELHVIPGFPVRKNARQPFPRDHYLVLAPHSIPHAFTASIGIQLLIIVFLASSSTTVN